jgi:membrane protease YdiL (CAAX protease family)
MPGPIDYAFVAFFAVVLSVFEYLVFWPRFRAAILSGAPNARRDGYRRVLIGQWLIAGVAIAIWASAHRPWRDLGLVVPGGWRLAVSIALVAVVALLAALQLRSVLRVAPEKRAALRPKLGALAFLLPHTREEYRWFSALSITAGVCEELLFRGFLLWTLRPWLGLYGAALAVVVLFGAGHAYQGGSSGIRATAAGAAMTGIVLLTGWLIPAMAVHALMDLSAGVLGYVLLRDETVRTPHTTAPSA